MAEFTSEAGSFLFLRWAQCLTSSVMNDVLSGLC